MTKKLKSKYALLAQSLKLTKTDAASMAAAKEDLRQMLRVRRKQLIEVKRRARDQQQKDAYDLLGSKALEPEDLDSQPSDPPTPEQVNNFWSGILTTERECDTDSRYIWEWRDEVGAKVKDGEPVTGIDSGESGAVW